MVCTGLCTQSQFQIMDEGAHLMTVQLALEEEADGKVAFFGQGVNKVIQTCLTNGMMKHADKIKSDFKVPDKWCTLSDPTVY